ncbi:MAG: T9SS type A sorting domain-containing protein, partial [Candidatus Krumholzibacteriota bacterium]|nr:T9SS type A sorting domain-containing protein [Candidatus Krumholzibacteriota bacterium]
FQNYPNPFNPTTTIAFILEEAGPVDLDIYDAAGRRIKTLVRGWKTGGRHQVVWNGTDQSSRTVSAGVYFARMRARRFHSTIKLLLVR